MNTSYEELFCTILGQVKPFHSASLSFFPASSWELWLWVIIRNLSEGFVWTFRAVASPSLHVPTQNITFSIVWFCLDRLCDRKLESVVCLCWGTMLSSHPMLCLVNPPHHPLHHDIILSGSGLCDRPSDAFRHYNIALISLPEQTLRKPGIKNNHSAWIHETRLHRVIHGHSAFNMQLSLCCSDYPAGLDSSALFIPFVWLTFPFCSVQERHSLNWKLDPTWCFTDVALNHQPYSYVFTNCAPNIRTNTGSETWGTYLL